MNTQKCLEWAKERGLLDTPDTSKQFQKLASECMEFLDEINKGNLEKAFLEFGDVLVTMIIYCEQRGLDFQKIIDNHIVLPPNGLKIITSLGHAAEMEDSEMMYRKHRMHDFLGCIYDICIALAPQFDPQRALDAAVEKISNRKTVLFNGTAVKEEDLQIK